MKNLFFIVILAVTIAGCGDKSKAVIDPLPDRGLQIHVILRDTLTQDESNVANANIKVFNTRTSWLNNSGPLFTLDTDSSGIALFEFLRVDSHFIRVEHVQHGLLTDRFRTPLGTISFEEIFYLQ